MAAFAGDTVTEATGAGGGAVTVSAAEPLCPSLDATMFAEPALTAVATPLELTVATPVLALDHVIVRPVRALPLASRVVAENCTEPPTVTLEVVGATETDA